MSWVFTLVDREKVTAYPTYGYKEDGKWRIPIRVWVHEDRREFDLIIRGGLEIVDNLDENEKTNFRLRILDFLADNESGEEVTIRFNNDPDGSDIPICNTQGEIVSSDLNGIIEGFITLSDDKARALLAQQNSNNGWLSFRVSSRGHEGSGLVRLVEPEGLSVISDIDDTIKITEILEGRRSVVINTFFQDFRHVENMVNLYIGLGQASFHYVTGSPWQLFNSLSEFLFRENVGFPWGSFHMRNVRTNLATIAAWEDLQSFTCDEATMNQKLEQITEIMRRFPRRRFILIGDSGERDPEVYHRIRQQFGGRIEEIWIRDVRNDQQGNPGRVDGMRIIDV